MAVKRTKQPSRHRAVTADIVGNTQTTKSIPAKWKKYHARLVKMRDYLLQRQNDSVKDAKQEQPAFSLHMADAGTDMFDRDLTLSRVSSEQDALYEVNEALARIRDGPYGICELTGKPIERARLDAIPWTRFSATAEKQLEKEGSIHRARVSPREAVARNVNDPSEAEGSTEDE